MYDGFEEARQDLSRQKQSIGKNVKRVIFFLHVLVVASTIVLLMKTNPAKLLRRFQSRFFSAGHLILLASSLWYPEAMAQGGAPLPPIETVAIGKNREFLVNGEPFLPIFGWMQKPATLPRLKEIGFNAIGGYWRDKDGLGDLKTADKFGESAWSSGLYFIAPFVARYPDEMKALKGSPNLLAWFQEDEPDLLKTKSEVVISSSKLKLNPKRPLMYLADGNPKTSAVLSPLAGSEVTITYPNPATITKLTLANGPDGKKAGKVSVSAGGREIAVVDLPDSTETRTVDLASPVTVKEITVKFLEEHPLEDGPKGPFNWGTITDIGGLDADGKNVLAYPATKQPQYSPEEVRANFAAIKKFDTTRPVMLTFASFFLEDFYDKSWYTRAQAEALYPQYVGSADIYGIDIYPIFGWNQPENIHWVDKSNRQLRKLVGASVPTFQWIETRTGPFGDNAKPVTGVEIRNQVYQALASGCTAIGYFTHQIKPTLIPFATPPENQEAIKLINAEITALAPDLLADEAPVQPVLEIAGGLRSLCHATLRGDTLTVVAVNMDGQGLGGTATLTLPGLKAGTEISVVGENRVIKAGDGEWKDTFAPLAVHVYQLKP